MIPTKKILYRGQWYEIHSGVELPPIQRRGKASVLNNDDELVQKGLIGIMDGTFKSYAQAGRELAKDAKLKTPNEKDWRSIYPTEMIADRLARKISKARKLLE